jgi:acetylornithine deacetylase
MRALRSELARDHSRPELDPEWPTMNFGRIEGGDNPNRICGRCTLDYDVRVLPGMDYELVRSEIRNRVAASIAGRGVTASHVALTPYVPPFETPQSAPIVRAVEALAGRPATGVAFGTEAPFLTELGMDTVVLGPGDISVAHQPDEHLPLARIQPMLAILRGVIERCCVRGEA